ncbi:MAG: NADH-quinone oxidoreductase subunit L, partial [Clostridiales bacterium]|nr:NADH-quinone oxidoreductase subunit L [Clostridiales bacterium]
MDKYLLLAVAILLPAIAAVLCRIIRNGSFRRVVVILTSVVMAATAVMLAFQLNKAGGRLEFTFEGLPLDIGWIIEFLDLALMIYIIYIGISLRKVAVVVLAALQLIPAVGFEIFGAVESASKAFIIDYLSLVMIFLVSIVGPLVVIFALGYMDEHEHHKKIAISKQPKFFMVMLVFLGAMNALVMTNDLMWMYFFWEVTTLCSFLLISHDGSPEAVGNAVRALWMNMLGGVGFISGIIIIYKATGTLAIDELISKGAGTALTGMLPLGLALLCFAGLTKSAQMPFQSWLLGAMVAPTPVSALLHSSTMVKAGVYLIVRFSPMYGGTMLGNLIAVIGGFTFMATSALAISQRNSKRVLAYSTIANLGLIVCCAGIGTAAALGAAIMLMIFHAVSKGLLFLCVGTVEHGIGSRDIEDMQGLFRKMPLTTVIMVTGMISMLLPPFGVLMTKWIAIEAAVNLPLVLIFIILGSAFTVFFWSKWIGIILTMSYRTNRKLEKLMLSVKGTLLILSALVLGASIFMIPLFNFFVAPQLEAYG